MIDGKREEMGLQKAPSFEEIVKLTDDFAEAVRKVLERLNGQRGFYFEIEDREKTHMFYLSIGKFKRVFRLGIPHNASPENRPHM
jgi:DNA replication initiation complex subunit (GINS family)